MFQAFILDSSACISLKKDFFFFKHNYFFSFYKSTIVTSGNIYVNSSFSTNTQFIFDFTIYLKVLFYSWFPWTWVWARSPHSFWLVCFQSPSTSTPLFLRLWFIPGDRMFFKSVFIALLMSFAHFCTEIYFTAFILFILHFKFIYTTFFSLDFERALYILRLLFFVL